MCCVCLGGSFWRGGTMRGRLRAGRWNKETCASRGFACVFWRPGRVAEAEAEAEADLSVSSCKLKTQKFECFGRSSAGGEVGVRRCTVLDCEPQAPIARNSGQLDARGGGGFSWQT